MRDEDDRFSVAETGLQEVASSRQIAGLPSEVAVLVEELSEFDEGPLPSDWVGELNKRGIAVQTDLLREQAREVFHKYRAAQGRRY